MSEKHIIRNLGSSAFPANARHAMTKTLRGTRNTEVIVARRWLGTSSARATAIAGQ